MTTQNDELTPAEWLIVVYLGFWLIGPAFIESEYASHSYGAVFPVLFKGAINTYYIESGLNKDGFSWGAAIFIQCVMIITIFGGSLLALGFGNIVNRLCNKIGI